MEVNDDSICCRDLLTNEFSIFSKTEHLFEIFDIKKVLKNCLKDVVEETEVTTDRGLPISYLELIENAYLIETATGRKNEH